MEDKKKDKNEPKTEESKTDGDKDDNAKLIEKALKSFCCYLYVGKGHHYYKARPWNDDDSYSISERLQSLDVLASNKVTELVPIDKIKLAMDSKLIRRPETLMFALAMCARQRKSEKLRAAAYYFLAEHCKEWKYFILFIKYASILCKMEDDTDKDKTSKHIGWGHGWKNAVNKWYLTKDPMELASLVVKQKGGCGWKHKDILKLSHPDGAGLEVEKRAILCYVIRGIEEAEKQYLSDPEAQRILKYIRRIELFKRTQKPSEVNSMLVDGDCTIDDVHPSVLKSKGVWIALVAKMDVGTVLKYLPKMNELGLLTKVSPLTELVVQILTDENNLRWNKLLPGDILSVLDRYEEAPTIMCSVRMTIPPQVNDSQMEGLTLESKAIATHLKKRTVFSSGLAPVGKPNERLKSKKRITPGRMIKCPPAPKPAQVPDVTIRVALRTALSITRKVDITGDSKRTYFVSIRLPSRKRRVNVCTEAGLAIALPLLHRLDIPESAVTIIGYEPQMLMGSPPEITRDTEYDDALQMLNKLKRYDYELQPMKFSPVGWAIKNKKKYDIFINVTNEPPHKTFFQIFTYYREHYEPKARLVNVITSPTPFELTCDGVQDTLTINGFDPHVPWIIEAYARGLF